MFVPKHNMLLAQPASTKAQEMHGCCRLPALELIPDAWEEEQRLVSSHLRQLLDVSTSREALMTRMLSWAQGSSSHHMIQQPHAGHPRSQAPGTKVPDLVVGSKSGLKHNSIALANSQSMNRSRKEPLMPWVMRVSIEAWHYHDQVRNRYSVCTCLCMYGWRNL